MTRQSRFIVFLYSREPGNTKPKGNCRAVKSPRKKNIGHRGDEKYDILIRQLTNIMQNLFWSILNISIDLHCSWIIFVEFTIILINLNVKAVRRYYISPNYKESHPLPRPPESIPVFFLHAKEQNLLLSVGMVMSQMCQAL